MKDIAAEKGGILKKEALRLASVCTATVLLCVLVLLDKSFWLQFGVFLIILWASGDILHDGLDALGAFEINTESLVFISSVATLVHGISAYQNDNYFALSASTLALAMVGRYLLYNVFKSDCSYRSVADRVCSVFVPIILIAFLVLIITKLWQREGVSAAFSESFAFLSVSCPFAIGMISPLPLLLAFEKAAERGIRIGNSSVMEKLGKVGEIWFEEREVVFTGEARLYDIYSCDADKISLLSAAAALETRAEHPYAKAITDAARKLGIDIPLCENYSELHQTGVIGEVGTDRYFLGNKKYLRDKKIELPTAVKKANFGSCIPIYAVKNGKFAGVLLFCREKNRFIHSIVRELRRLEIKSVLICSGDSKIEKGNFDILTLKEEKVLQEEEKSDRIKATVVRCDKIGSEDVACAVYPSDKCDIILGKTENIMPLIDICRKARSVTWFNVLISFVFTGVLAFGGSVFRMKVPSCAVAFALSFVMFLFVVLNSLRIKRCQFTEITALEEEDMFGKVNYTMKIDGMSCAHCSARVKMALESFKGVSAKISLEDKVARIKCPASLDVEEMAKAVNELGFTVVSTEKV